MYLTLNLITEFENKNVKSFFYKIFNEESV
jgi:hypothetical protein